MACAAMRRSCTFRNSYITVVNSPGCTCTERWAGLKLHGPRALASNSTVIVRDLSTCVFAGSRASLLAGPEPPGARGVGTERRGDRARPVPLRIGGPPGFLAGHAVAGPLPLGERQ